MSENGCVEAERGDLALAASAFLNILAFMLILQEGVVPGWFPAKYYLSIRINPGMVLPLSIAPPHDQGRRVQDANSRSRMAWFRLA